MNTQLPRRVRSSTLPPDSAAYPNERLQAMLPSSNRPKPLLASSHLHHPQRRSQASNDTLEAAAAAAHAAPMLDGAAAFAEVVLLNKRWQLSARLQHPLVDALPPTKRRQEVEAVLRHRPCAPPAR